MKIRVVTVLACVSILATGCASSGSSYTTKSTRYGPPPLENDMAYVRAVEAAAKRHGVGVYWVHPPRKDVKPDRE